MEELHFVKWCIIKMKLFTNKALHEMQLSQLFVIFNYKNIFIILFLILFMLYLFNNQYYFNIIFNINYFFFFNI